MADITIQKLDETYIKVTAKEPWMEHDIQERFCFEKPEARFDPRVRSGRWDGKIRLYNRKTHTLYLGLYYALIEFLNKQNRSYEIIGDDILPIQDVSADDINEYVKLINPHCPTGPIYPYDYQIEALLYMLSLNRTTCLAATSAGKSLILYLASRIYQMIGAQRIFLIVPSTQLVEQMYSDFGEYSTFKDSTWHVYKNCQKISGKYSKVINQPIVITTWQSLAKMEYAIKESDVIFVDEVHTVRGKVLTDLMELATQCGIRHGVTGTLDGVECNELITQGLLGPVKRIVTAKQLIDDKRATQIDVDMILFDYPEQDKKDLHFLKLNTPVKLRYTTEIEYIYGNIRRNRALQDFISCLKGNTLVLFDRVEDYGIKLYEEMKAKHENTFLIVGDVEAKVREEIRQIVESYDDAIIYASFGTMSTGVSIKKLHNLVFASSTKSVIRVLQSIGRLMRLHKSKDVARIYDIVDKINHRHHSNYALDHSEERLKYYTAESFNVKFHTVDLSAMYPDKTNEMTL